ncbi:DUF3040 domain-containing protein [Actinomadura opuntiae]|uniref:DUF3040 domain-containing protein n=1 Tax=Actinomadura sp. OS1-43 TaxID=604315 RepID=UPI00255A999A|nr:DUF3040 domain-containing protein [Actinomadura sp. OS1-43]MDL4814284.1 DUF3040 domain-containing protein [Actinomadura sp. OS1-43]
MSLSIRERLILRRIERELRSRDPGLAALLEGHGAGAPAVVASPQELPAWWLMGFALCVIAAVVLLGRYSPVPPGTWYPPSAPDSPAAPVGPAGQRQAPTLQLHPG